MEAKSWIRQIQKTFKISGCSEGQKVPFSTYMFEGEASFWWEIVELLLSVNGEETILWDTFVVAFYKKYFLESVRHQKEAEFIDLEQGSMTVASYWAKFTELACFAPYMITNKPARVSKVQRGLKQGICIRLAYFLLIQYFDIINRALVIE